MHVRSLLLLGSWAVQAQELLVTTLAGSGAGAFADGVGTAAAFNRPAGVAVGAGVVFVADLENNRIRTIFDGVVTTLAGSGAASFADGFGTAASFFGPCGIALGRNVLFVAEMRNHRIRALTLSGNVTTLAGNGTAAFAGGSGTSAAFSGPQGIAVDMVSGIVVVADTNNNRVRVISLDGTVTTLAGISAFWPFADGPVSLATFYGPAGVVVGGDGAVYVTDQAYERVRKIAFGVVGTTAGNGTMGHTDGISANATFCYPFGIAADTKGGLIIVDRYNNVIRYISPHNALVTTLAGSGKGGFADGPASSAAFNSPLGVAVSASGVVFIADFTNHRIRAIAPATPPVATPSAAPPSPSAAGASTQTIAISVGVSAGVAFVGVVSTFVIARYRRGSIATAGCTVSPAVTDGGGYSELRVA